MPLNGVFATLYGIAGLSLIALTMGVALRGGIEVGLAIEIYDDEVYGRALSDAYTLESTVAQYPRVVVGKAVQDYLEGFKTRSGSSRLEIGVRDHATNCQRFITTDPVDGQPMIDFLGRGMRDIGKTPTRKLAPRAHAMVKTTVDEMSKTGETKLRTRYERLLQYFDRRMYLWT